jgi:hypothetical protein
MQKKRMMMMMMMMREGMDIIDYDIKEGYQCDD